MRGFFCILYVEFLEVIMAGRHLPMSAVDAALLKGKVESGIVLLAANNLRTKGLAFRP
jgi:hypothetical protein